MTDEGTKPNGGGGTKEDVRVCGTCYYIRASTAASGVCMLNPPASHVVMQPRPSLDPTKTTVQQMPAFVRPEVKADDFCSSHRYDDELSPVEIIASELSSIADMLRAQTGAVRPAKRVT